MVAKIFSLSASGILYALVHAVVASTLQDKCLHVVMILQKGTLRQQTGEVSYFQSQIPQVVNMVFEYRQSDYRACTLPTPLSCHPVALCLSKSCWHSKVPSDQHMADEPRALSLSRTSYKAYQGDVHTMHSQSLPTDLTAQVGSQVVCPQAPFWRLKPRGGGRCSHTLVCQEQHDSLVSLFLVLPFTFTHALL